MALANTSGGPFDKRNVKNNTGSILNAGDSENSTDLNISDSTSVNKQRSKAVFVKDGTGSSTSDRAGIQTSVPGSELAHNSNPDEWVMFSNNVNANLQSRDYAGNLNDNATLANRGHTDSKLYGSGSLAEFNILARPDTEISTGRTKPANAGQSAKFVAPKTGGDVVSSGYRPSRSNPGKINWNLGGIPQSVNYASKERGEFELPAAAAGSAPVLRFTIKHGGTTDIGYGWQARTVTNPGPLVIPNVSAENNDSDVDFTVDWGDGNSEVITGTPSFGYQDNDYNIPNQSNAIGHKYAQTGIYNVSISGKFDKSHLAISSNLNQNVYDSAEHNTLLSVEEWGGLKIDYFFPQDFLFHTRNLTFVKNVYNNFSVPLFTNLPTDAPEITTTHLDRMFSGCTNFNSPINNWDISNVQSLKLLFYDAPLFNQPLDNWNTSSVQDMTGLFYATQLFLMGLSAMSFDQDISNWDFSSITSGGLTYFGYSLGLSPANYDALLIRWAEQAASIPAQSNVTMGTSRYSAGGAGATARNTLINTYGWTITDGGAV